MRDLRKLVVSGVVATSLILGSGSVFAASFDDVSGSQSEMAITKLVSLGYIVNKGSNFNPDSGLSRLEFADIANKIINLGKPATVKIKDLTTSGGKNANAVKLVKGGFIQLTKKGEFLPKKAVTYAELSKVLATGLGFKQSWSNRPIDFLFFLDRKGVLDIGTNLDAAVTKENAAVAIDKYLEVKNVYKDVVGVIQDSSPTSITLKTKAGLKVYKIASNSSLFINDDATDTDALGLGTEAHLILDNSGKVAFVDAVGIDSVEGTLGYAGGKITINSNPYNVNLNVIVPNLPSGTSDFTFKDFSAYTASGVTFKGSCYTNLQTDWVTALNAYIYKVDNRSITVSPTGGVVFDFSDVALNNLSFATDTAKISVTIGDKTTDSSVADLSALQQQGYKMTASLEAGADGAVTKLNVTATAPAPTPTK
ncbi:S-layer homology domain-containing protein [Bacillus sp. RG28]|uniref:S-layer homology domain-containing protein n=1 Tax=Gottfriedia endophytica TaxID=2820819 RepID=A0A940SFQ6_9BACI|nr:S-layer homology domain-containing protein [Gottfriedia endophytica]MBP0724247.1 S-layer homology domain-containing protein [Gottfriedia endophytica]